MPFIPAEDVRDGQLVDMFLLLSDPRAYFWVHAPFGMTADDRHEQQVAAQMVSESEYAIAESSHMTDEGIVTVYTDQGNVNVPRGFLIPIP